MSMILIYIYSFYENLLSKEEALDKIKNILITNESYKIFNWSNIKIKVILRK